MADPRLTRLAALLVEYCTSVREGDWVLIMGHVAALPLIEETVRMVAAAGGNPTVQLSSEGLDEAMLDVATDAQLAWSAPTEALLADRIDVRISILAASNTRSLSFADPKRAQVYQRAKRQHQQQYMQRAADGDFRWALTIFPCAAFAQEADMSLREYEDFVYSATFADQPDPAEHWVAMRHRQQRLVDWLQGKSHVEVKGPHVDLSLSIAGRTFMNSDGKRNMPSGEIFTGPVEESVNGWVRFSYPAIRGGREVEGVEMRFEQGKVVQASARKNEEFLRSQLEMDAGACYLGEFAIGTNNRIQRFTKNILFDEKIGGTMHMAVGSGYPETGSLNRSALHWDFICDMRTESEIRVDGELFYQNGRFLIEE